MKRLYELSKLIRSKNAGPFMMSLDVLFGDRGTYEKVLATGALSAENIAKLYGVPPDRMHVHLLPLGNAVKFSFPRRHPSGDFLDDDLYGCQNHRPLMMLEIPVD